MVELISSYNKNVRVLILSNGGFIIGEVDKQFMVDNQIDYEEVTMTITNPHNLGLRPHPRDPHKIAPTFSKLNFFGEKDVVIMNANCILGDYEPKDVVKRAFHDFMEQVEKQKSAITIVGSLGEVGIPDKGETH